MVAIRPINYVPVINITEAERLAKKLEVHAAITPTVSADDALYRAHVRGAAAAIRWLAGGSAGNQLYSAMLEIKEA